MSTLTRTLEAYQSHSGVRQKAPIHLVSEVLGRSDWLTGPGDDGAYVPTTGGQIVVGGEAMFPPFVATDPRGAGFAAVLANVNDLAAMGASPLAIVDTIVGPQDVSEAVLDGMRDASAMYEVPIVGGHLTRSDGPAAVSAFGIGEASQLLSVRNVEPGQAIVLACSIDGTMRDDFPFFASFEQRRALMAGDVRVLADVAAAREAVAAKDVSMAGLIGSLAMLLEARQAGAHLRLETVPVPEGVDAARWLISFPAYAFLLCTRPDSVEACTSRFAARGLTAVQIGEVTGSGELVVTDGDESETFVRFPHDRITGLTPP